MIIIGIFWSRPNFTVIINTDRPGESDRTAFRSNFNMKLHFLLSLLILPLFLLAQPTATDTIENTKSLLWRIDHTDLAQPSYLYGTIHMIDANDFFLTDSTLVAFDATERVTFEINLEDEMNLFSQLSLMSKMFMDDDLTLKALLTEEEYASVEQHFAKMGMGGFMFGMLEKIKPLFLTVFASGDIQGGMQSGSVKSYEMELWDMAKKRKKPVGGLETAAFQMSVFDSIPYKAQADMLVQAIEAGEDGSDQLDELTKIYREQDIEAMVKTIGEDEGGMADYEEILLNTRNRNWIPVMGVQMREMPTFFAVGAGHLGGEVGVIRLLREAGYEVTPVFSKVPVNQ